MASQKIDEKELTRLLQDEAMQLPDMGIVVSGISGRFPKSDSVSEFEENLLKGNDMINDQDNSRFTCGLWNLPPRAGRLKDLSKFDCEFFGYTADEANYLDYQMRILYEVVYESILDAGVNPASLRGSNTGVFFGLHCNEFENAMAGDPGFKTNGYYAQYAVKVAQYFDLRGITVTFDAACASGFVGLHNAVEALNNGIVDQAIVCSSNIPIHPTGSFIFLQMQMLSPTGYSRFLDSRADGYVKSEACVSVLLQRKHLALRNYGSIMATMTSVDGYKSEGITFPSDASQERLIRSSKNLAGISTNNIEYLEAHGTGTPAGDPQEARAISNVYYPIDEDMNEGETGREGVEIDRRTIGPLLVGSVKTNMGHSEAASGLCSLTKVVMMLENELIYKGLHYAQPNSNIESLMDGRLRFVEETMELRSKIIPLSCYGFGGSNVHVIVRANHRSTIESALEETSQIDGGKTPRLITMFGRTKEALNLFFNRILNSDQSRATRNCLSDDFLALVDAINLGPIDRRMEYRGFLVVDRRALDLNFKELARAIRKCQLAPVRNNRNDKSLQLVDLGRQAHVQDCAQRECNLFFPGLGCQWASMAKGLTGYHQFWQTIERLAEILKPFEDEVNLRHLLTDSTDESFESMVSKFVAIVAYQIALTNIVRDQLKLKNLSCIVGHSLGEISCAYAAGLFGEREAIMVAYRMGKTLYENKKLISGKMVALDLDEGEALKLIGHGYRTIRVSCVNGPKSVTISGSNEEMEKFCSSLEQNKSDISMKRIDSDIALHNECIMSSEIEQLLKESISKVLFPLADYKIKSTSWVSSISAEATDANADYFASSLCKKVDLMGALDHAVEDSIILELGPSGLFESQLLQIEGQGRRAKFHYNKMMKHSTPPEQQSLMLTVSMGELYQAGAMLDLTHFYHEDKLELPVRRQTPSLSSIFQWDHQHNLFVPRYPIQFSKSSAKSEMPVDIVQDRDKYLTGHCIEGRVLFPATGYLFLIWRVISFTKRRIFDACFQDVEHELVPIEFHNVRLLRAVMLGNRVVQVYIHYEEGTGRFEIREGGSVVVEGYACTPADKPQDLLYNDIKEQIKGEKLELTLNADDIYKQFRVSGYDYGETFRCIESASTDGRYCRVKYNGHFIAFTDSILQSIFLAVAQYAPSGGLFLPTRFDYVRFQPEIILEKLRQAKVPFDLSDGSLNTKEKRAIMMKMMERSETGNKAEVVANDEEMELNTDGGCSNDSKVESDANTVPECIFEAFCDPITGIIITDGIEMRGIKASPAPRRSDNSSEILLESYQFVADHEDPIQDEHLTKFDQSIRPYTQICDFMSLELLAQMTGKPLTKMFNQCIKITTDDVEAYKVKHLSSIYKTRVSKHESHDKEDHHYDIKKNGDRMLMSILDQLCGCGDSDPKAVRELVQKNRQMLMRDLIQTPLTSERFMRPVMELVMENTCLKKTKLRVLEVNVDDGLLKGPLQHLCQSVAPSIALDYALAHPEPSRVSNQKALVDSQTRIYQLKDLHSLFNDHQMSDLDLIVYKDISCYSLPKQVVEQNGLAPVLSSLNGAVRRGGFVMIIMRQHLSLAERILLSLCEPELVGLSKKDLDQLGAIGSSNKTKKADLTAADKIEHINSILASRCRLMLSEAESNKMICLAKKSDPNGCTVLLFKVTNNSTISGPYKSNETNRIKKIKRVSLRVTHEDQQSIDRWLLKLKEIFKPEPDNKAEEQKFQGAGEQEQEESPPEVQVWLCAVDTKQNQVSGLVGMMQALGKEIGRSRLRCYYDCHTFMDRNEPITMEDIEQCSRFQESVTRDLYWNCIDSTGRFGAFRHLTINDYISYNQCLCNNSSMEQAQLATCAYVNNATRGDLSSFTWYEAPYKYLDKTDQNNVIQIAYSALNFRDIMLASGRLPLDAIPIRLAMSDCLLGLEFSGYDPNGKRVAGIVPGRGIATHVLCPEQGAVKLEIPDWLSLEEAATIPVVYTTAIMALIYRGRMQRGESVLVHAGSGGVGQAAIRLASHFGLEIFATVGSPEKRQFLLEEFADTMRDDHIFSSRDCDFEAKIMEATAGRGVDLVLNSLADDKLLASVRCLANGGRFLEIGKYDMSTDRGLELIQLNHNKTFHGILLDKLFDVDDIGPVFKHQLDCILETLKEGFRDGYVKPIKSTVFKRNQIEEAFRYMAAGKHIGKVLIEIDGEPRSEEAASTINLPQLIAPPRLSSVPRCQFSPVKSYIVTGGLGGFGLELAKWLANNGVRHIVLTSRHGIKSGYQRSTVSRLIERYGAQIEVIKTEQADACTPEGAERLCQLALDLSPERQLGAIFHLAMVLKDTLLDNMSSEDFERVCRPKVEAGIQLDRVTRERGLKLDYFVCFSSVTSGKGNAGQSNYAYANSCLERICERRRRHIGEHGLAIQWGAIGDVGVAFENLGGNDVIVGGTIPQRIPSCLATLAKMLASPFAICLSVVPVNRGPSGSGAGQKGDLVGAIMHVLGIKDGSKVSEKATLGELGLDSLMAVEIRQYIEREYELTLNIHEIRSLTIAKIREINENGKSTAAASIGAPTNPTPADSIKDEPKSVESYGKCNPTEATISQETNNGAATNNLSPLSKEMKHGLANGGGVVNDNVPTLDKDLMGSFLPELSLPKGDYVRLNYNHLSDQQQQQQQRSDCTKHRKPLDGNGYQDANDLATSGEALKRRPIFFIPPIHGQFNRLELVCSNIERPCIGLQWTRKLGRVQTAAEAVEIYLDLLRRSDWRREFQLPGSETSDTKEDANNAIRIVDLVGYSFGATIAFEMMIAIHKLEQRAKRRLANGLADNQTGGLRPGRLVLLDGSPKQIELGSRYLEILSRRNKSLHLADKIDELLMFYMVAHTRSLGVDYAEVKSHIQGAKIEDKIRVASERLAEILGFNSNGSAKKNGGDSMRSKREESDSEIGGDKQLEIAYAMEAFCRRYELITNYKATLSLPNDCALIRADKVYLKKGNSFKEDLDLSSIVRGKVSLHVMAGDHESFLDGNRCEIGEIISNFCTLSE